MQDFDTVLEPKMGGASYEVIALGNALAADPLTARSILDLGCGDGRNAFLLAGVGATVVALDRDGSDLAILASLAEQYSRPITTINSCASKYSFTEDFDIILSHGLLHFLSFDEAECLVQKSKTSTRDGGYNIYTIAHFKSPSEIISDFIEQGHRNSISSSDICSMYRDWELVVHDEYVKWDAHPGDVRHVHPISKLIFKKAGGKALLMPEKTAVFATAAEERATNWIALGDRIGATVSELRSAIGSADWEHVASSTGPQFGFKIIEPTGYQLQFQFFGRIVFYIASGVVAGFAKYEDHFTKIKVCGVSGR